jgi:hypothetical protein
MALYLVVAHQTAASPELIAHLQWIGGREPDAEFVLLVPATPVTHLLTWTEGESLEVARTTATEAGRVLRAAGVNLIDTVIGTPDPLEAIEAEHQMRTYDATIVSTLPLGVSRWLKRDLPSRVRSKVEGEVVHVVSQAEAAKKRAVA